MSYSPNDISLYLNMHLEDYNSMMALTGILCGFTFLFFACLLAVNIGKGK